jgi:hypothetical protein
MTKNVHTFTDPNGTVHIRKSVNREYTHAVIARKSKACAVAFIMADDWAAREAHNFGYYTAMVAGTHKNAKYTLAFEKPEEREARRSQEVEFHKTILADAVDAEAFVAMIRKRALATIEASDKKGVYTDYTVIGWNGRVDLAQKLASSNATREYIHVQIVEVTHVVK